MTKFKYVGGGEFYTGIPARDLSDDDWARLNEAQQAVVAASPLYEAVPKKTAASKEKEGE